MSQDAAYGKAMQHPQSDSSLARKLNMLLSAGGKLCPENQRPCWIQHGGRVCMVRLQTALHSCCMEQELELSTAGHCAHTCKQLLDLRSKSFNCAPPGIV